MTTIPDITLEEVLKDLYEKDNFTLHVEYFTLPPKIGNRTEEGEGFFWVMKRSDDFKTIARMQRIVIPPSMQVVDPRDGAASDIPVTQLIELNESVLSHALNIMLNDILVDKKEEARLVFLGEYDHNKVRTLMGLK